MRWCGAQARSLFPGQETWELMPPLDQRRGGEIQPGTSPSPMAVGVWTERVLVSLPLRGIKLQLAAERWLLTCAISLQQTPNFFPLLKSQITFHSFTDLMLELTLPTHQTDK